MLTVLISPERRIKHLSILPESPQPRSWRGGAAQTFCCRHLLVSSFWSLLPLPFSAIQTHQPPKVTNSKISPASASLHSFFFFFFYKSQSWICVYFLACKKYFLSPFKKPCLVCPHNMSRSMGLCNSIMHRDGCKQGGVADMKVSRHMVSDGGGYPVLSYATLIIL